MGMLGVGYATWSQTLTITQTVNTGELEVGIRDVGTNDDDANNDGIANAGTGNVDPGWQNGAATVYDKDVANTVSVNGELKFTKEIDGVPTDFYHSVSDTISNAYPSYAPTIVFEITNNGTIPVKLKLLLSWVEDKNNPWNLDPFVDVAAWTATSPPRTAITGGSGNDFASMFSFLEGYQLEECDTLRLEMTKHILQEFDVDGNGQIDLPEEECPMNATVTYTFTVNAVQWNLY